MVGRRRVVRRAGIGLLGATAVAGTAYAVGSSSARRSAQDQQQEARLAELEAAQAAGQAPPQYAPPPQYPPPPQYAPPPPQAAPMSQEDRINQLKQIADLKQAGVLTAEEFEREKQRILTS